MSTETSTVPSEQFRFRVRRAKWGDERLANPNGDRSAIWNPDNSRYIEVNRPDEIMNRIWAVLEEVVVAEGTDPVVYKALDVAKDNTGHYQKLGLLEWLDQQDVEDIHAMYEVVLEKNPKW